MSDIFLIHVGENGSLGNLLQPTGVSTSSEQHEVTCSSTREGKVAQFSSIVMGKPGLQMLAIGNFSHCNLPILENLSEWEF